MRPEERTLTDRERAALDTIEATPAQPSTDEAGTNEVAKFCAILRDSAPQPDDAYRRRLREQVLAVAPQRPTVAPLRRERRFTRRQVLAAGVAAATLSGAALAFPQTRIALAGWLGWSVDQRATPLPLVLEVDRGRWAGDQNARYEYQILAIQRERWAMSQRYPAPTPPPGSIVKLPDGRALPVPAYLPPGFGWQGIARPNESNPNTGPFRFPFASLSGGGGGSGLPWERFPEYDRRVAAYLIGGDPADRVLALTQLKRDAQRGLLIGIFQIDAPAQPAPTPAAGAPASQGGTRPTPTPPPSAHAAHVVLGLIVQPTGGSSGLSIQTGGYATHDTAVGGTSAKWFSGTWTRDGQWVDDGTWLTVIWERGEFVYHLAGQRLDLAEVLRVAESLPQAP